MMDFTMLAHMYCTRSCCQIEQSVQLCCAHSKRYYTYQRVKAQSLVIQRPAADTNTFSPGTYWLN